MQPKQLESGVTEIGWGNQIRSYVMQPYTMVKDHREADDMSDNTVFTSGVLIRKGQNTGRERRIRFQRFDHPCL